MEERWSSIDDTYSISSEGRIRNDKTNNILKEYKDQHGRPRVRVKLNNNKNISISREVYKAFIDKNLKDTDIIYRKDVNKPASKDNIYLSKGPRRGKYSIGSIVHGKYEVIAYEKMVKSSSLNFVYILKCLECNCICLCNITNMDVTKKHRCLCNVKKKDLLI